MNIDYTEYKRVVNGLVQHAQIMARRIGELESQLKETSDEVMALREQNETLKDQLIQREAQISSLESCNKKQVEIIYALREDAANSEKKLTAFGAKKGGKK